MEIIPDPVHTLLLTIPFFVAMIGMHVILWRPLLDWMEERDTVSTSARKEADELDHAAEAQLARIEERLTAARHEVVAVRSEARGRALAKEAEIVGAARNKAEGRVTEEVTRIQQERDNAQKSLGDEAKSLSGDIAGRVLGRQVA